jgi:plastocyanin
MRRIIAVVSTFAIIMLGGVFAVPVAQAGDPCWLDDSRPPLTAGTGSIVKLDTCAFLPTIARVPVGTTVRFINSGTIEHMVTGANLAWGITGDKRLGPGDEFSAPFDKPGVYPFTCLLHPGMSGAIVVGSGIASADGGAATTGGASSAPVGSAPAAVANVGGTPQAPADATGPLPRAAAVLAVLLALLGSIAWLGRRRGAFARSDLD